MQREKITEQEFRKISERIVPHMNELLKIAREEQIEGGIRLYVSEGYLSFEGVGLCGWELQKFDGDYQMKFERRVPLSNKEDCDEK